jgi:hypothetical protein
VGQCAGLLLVIDGAHAAFEVSLSQSGSARYFSDAACTSEITQVNVAASDDRRDLYIEDGVLELVRFAATSAGNGSASFEASFEGSSSNPPQPSLEEGMVAHYTFDEGSGTVVGDSSGSGNNGKLSGNPLPVFSAGIAGDALSFNGMNSVQVPVSSSLGGMPALTVAGWLKPSGSGAAQHYVSARNNEQPWFAYDLSLTVNNTVEVQVINNAQQYAVSVGSTTLPMGQWSQVVAVYDDASILIYINGKLDGGAVGSLTGALYTVNAGLVLNFSDFTGGLDDLRIYKRALSASEVAALFDAAGRP